MLPKYYHGEELHTYLLHGIDELVPGAFYVAVDLNNNPVVKMLSLNKDSTRLLFRSVDSAQYPTYERSVDEIVEIWRVYGRFSREGA